MARCRRQTTVPHLDCRDSPPTSLAPSPTKTGGVVRNHSQRKDCGLIPAALRLTGRTPGLSRVDARRTAPISWRWVGAAGVWFRTTPLKPPVSVTVVGTFWSEKVCCERRDGIAKNASSWWIGGYMPSLPPEMQSAVIQPGTNRRKSAAFAQVVAHLVLRRPCEEARKRTERCPRF